MRIRNIYELRGVVQGVGFRPAVYRLAREVGVAGWIRNCAGRVRLALEAEQDRVTAFLDALPGSLPPQARLESITLVESRPADDARPAGEFAICDSSADDAVEVVIPADLAMCADCRAEILDPSARRHAYPFTTCTNCGPRYTVVTAMPYDRERTTLAAFPLCPACRAEYEAAADRRFRAETIACPACGPRVALETGAGTHDGRDALREARRSLARGEVVAVRGIGGFLLAADAFNRDTLVRLRTAKRRPDKPFAAMAPDLATLARYVRVPAEAAALLASPEAPILILDVRPEAARDRRLPRDLLTPDADTLGVMLPTSPLHQLLFEPAGDGAPRFELLVMTSGNRRSEPTCIRNEEARERLAGIADCFLVHDREIALRNDDSVCALQGGRPQVWRRARGYAPRPLRLCRPLARCVLAMGAEIKNTVALGFGDRVVLSPHVGDLETPEALDGLETVARRLPEFLGRAPDAVAVDLNPDMHASRLGRALAGEFAVPVIEVQHHRAHAEACLAEHGRDAGLALVFDGNGLGTDGTAWGAELIEIRPDGWRRLAGFAPVPLPGGDAAVRQPARQLVARWARAGVPISDEGCRRLGVEPEAAATWARQCVDGLNAPLSSGAGRVFDAFSAALGFAPRAITYEGQAAIRLETAARRHGDGPAPALPFLTREEHDFFLVDWAPAFAMLSDWGAVSKEPGAWAAAAHRAVADAAAAMVSYGFDASACRAVALSGGCFMNRVLSSLLTAKLDAMGAETLVHRETPPNDGCIALGQAVVAGTCGGAA